MKRTILATFALAACGGSAHNTPAPVPTPATPVAPAPDPTTTAAPPATPPTGHPSNDLIPRTAFFGNPEKVHPQISPDGKYLAWVAPKDGVLNVWVAPVDHMDQARAVTSDTTRPVTQYFWTFDKKHLLYLQDKAGDENFHLYEVDVTTPGDAVALTDVDKTRTEVFGVSPKKPGTILIGLNDRNPQYHDAYSVDLASGKRTLVLKNDSYAGFVVDLDLNVRFGATITPDGGSRLDELAPPKGAKPYTLTIGSDDALTTNVIGLDKSGKTLYLTDSRNRDTGALFTVDVRSGKEKLVAEDPRADLGAVMVNPTALTLEAVQIDYDKPTWKILDKKIQPDFDALAKVADGNFDVVSRTLDDKTWLVVFHSDTRPASYYRWDRKAKKATFMFDARSDLAKYTLAKMEPKIIKSRDGLDMVSYLTLPPGTDGPVPMVLWVHGGPWARDEWGFDPFAQFFASRGYAVLQVNYRGSTGFGKKFTNAANREWGGKMHDDLLDAVDWAVAQKITPKDQICIAGGSYGGYATLVGVTMTPDVFKCGVDLVGPSNLLTFIKTIPPYWAPAIALFKQRLGDWDDPDQAKMLKDKSPINHVDAIKVPLLIGQGANDPRVNVAESDQIVKAMQAKHIPVSYVLFPDEGHGFHRPENNLAFFAVAEAFLSAHLGGKYQPLSKDDFAGSTIKFMAGKDALPGLPSGL
ncbi:MAG TPA: S9 family peptidase [Kofleriaceae bacterium]|nr:S9 family peptidase [Kofleriaceae bacterium]